MVRIAIAGAEHIMGATIEVKPQSIEWYTERRQFWLNECTRREEALDAARRAVCEHNDAIRRLRLKTELAAKG